MNEIKVGDSVRRTSDSYRGMRPGDTDTVQAVDSSSAMTLTKFGGGHSPRKFEVVGVKPAKAPVPMILPGDPAKRKATPITTGVIDYFPRALAEVARLSKAGNDQHNPGQPLHWDKTKSTDHADCILRHLIDRHAVDTDNQRHAAKMAWRSLAFLETLLEQEERDAANAA